MSSGLCFLVLFFLSSTSPTRAVTVTYPEFNQGCQNMDGSAGWTSVVTQVDTLKGLDALYLEHDGEFADLSATCRFDDLMTSPQARLNELQYSVLLAREKSDIGIDSVVVQLNGDEAWSQDLEGVSTLTIASDGSDVDDYSAPTAVTNDGTWGAQLSSIGDTNRAAVIIRRSAGSGKVWLNAFVRRVIASMDTRATDVSPLNATVGDEIVLTGGSFDTSLDFTYSVEFSGSNRVACDVDSETQLRCSIPTMPSGLYTIVIVINGPGATDLISDDGLNVSVLNPVCAPACDQSSACAPEVCVDGVCEEDPTPEGTACADDFDVCTNDVCDGSGTCGHLLIANCGSSSVGDNDDEEEVDGAGDGNDSSSDNASGDDSASSAAIGLIPLLGGTGVALLFCLGVGAAMTSRRGELEAEVKGKVDRRGVKTLRAAEMEAGLVPEKKKEPLKTKKAITGSGARKPSANRRGGGGSKTRQGGKKPALNLKKITEYMPDSDLKSDGGVSHVSVTSEMSPDFRKL